MQCTDSIQCPEAIFSFYHFPAGLAKWKRSSPCFSLFTKKKTEQLHKIQNRSSTMVAFISMCVVCAFFSLSFFWLAVFFFIHFFSVCSHFSFVVFCFSRFLVGVVGLVHYMVAAHDDGLHFITIKTTKKARERDGVKEKEREREKQYSQSKWRHCLK